MSNNLPSFIRQFSPFSRLLISPFEGMESEMNQLMNWQNPYNDAQIESDEKNIYVKTPVPGFEESEIHISIKNATLYIQAEHTEDKIEKNKNRKVHQQARKEYSQTITLPEQVDENHISATLDNGMLMIELPKMTKSETKKITVKKKK